MKIKIANSFYNVSMFSIKKYWVLLCTMHLGFTGKKTQYCQKHIVLLLNNQVWDDIWTWKIMTSGSMAYALAIKPLETEMESQVMLEKKHSNGVDMMKRLEGWWWKMKFWRQFGLEFWLLWWDIMDELTCGDPLDPFFPDEKLGDGAYFVDHSESRMVQLVLGKLWRAWHPNSYLGRYKGHMLYID